ncbi:hydrolase, partial [Oryctes borbonicus]
LPGVEKLIKHLYKHGVPIALATSSSKFTMDVKTQYYQKLFSMFNHQVLGSTDPDVKYGKPAPDIFLVCASRFEDSPKPQNCLVFEDAPNGVKAAKSAGMQVVMVPSNEVSEELKKPATLVLNSLAEFRPEVFGLPAYEI